MRINVFKQGNADNGTESVESSLLFSVKVLYFSAFHHPRYIPHGDHTGDTIIADFTQKI